MKTKFNEVIQGFSAFVCNYSICTYQFIVFMNDRNPHSFLLFAVCAIISVLVQWVAALFYSLNKIKGADDVIYKQYNDSTLQKKHLRQIMPSNLIDDLIEETVYIQVANNFKRKTNKEIEKIKSNFVNNLTVILVEPPVGKVITPSAFTDIFGQGYLFLRNFNNVNSIPVLPKFRILHEISHSLFLSFSLIAEQIFAPLTYRILIVWIPWQLKWSWQSGIAFSILGLLALDTWGTTYWSNVKRTLIQSEINADIIAATLLSDEDKDLLLDNLSNNGIEQSIPLHDRNFNEDENYIRFRRLLTFLHTKNKNLDLMGIIAPVSSWDFTWRALMIILLATQSRSAGWPIIFLGILIAILLLFVWVFLIQLHQKYRLSIDKILTN